METLETTEQIIEDLKGGKHLVKLWAEWCGPCKSYAPVFDEVTKNLDPATNIKVRNVNVDKHTQIAQQFGVRGIPTTILLNEGKPTLITGVKTEADLKALIAEHLS